MWKDRSWLHSMLQNKLLSKVSCWIYNCPIEWNLWSGAKVILVNQGPVVYKIYIWKFRCALSISTGLKDLFFFKPMAQRQRKWIRCILVSWLLAGSVIWLMQILLHMQQDGNKVKFFWKKVLTITKSHRVRIPFDPPIIQVGYLKGGEYIWEIWR